MRAAAKHLQVQEEVNSFGGIKTLCPHFYYHTVSSVNVGLWPQSAVSSSQQCRLQKNVMRKYWMDGWTCVVPSLLSIYTVHVLCSCFLLCFSFYLPFLLLFSPVKVLEHPRHLVLHGTVNQPL